MQGYYTTVAVNAVLISLFSLIISIAYLQKQQNNQKELLYSFNKQ